MKRLAAILVAVATITTVGAQQGSTPNARTPQVTFTKDVAPILQELPALPSRRSVRADVAADLRGRQAVGRRSSRRWSARDAAVVHRPKHRHH